MPQSGVIGGPHAHHHARAAVNGHGRGPPTSFGGGGRKANVTLCNQYFTLYDDDGFDDEYDVVDRAEDYECDGIVDAEGHSAPVPHNDHFLLFSLDEIELDSGDAPNGIKIPGGRRRRRSRRLSLSSGYLVSSVDESRWISNNSLPRSPDSAISLSPLNSGDAGGFFALSRTPPPSLPIPVVDDVIVAPKVIRNPRGKPMNLPREVLGYILSFLVDGASSDHADETLLRRRRRRGNQSDPSSTSPLYNAMLVSRIWCLEALRHVWATTPLLIHGLHNITRLEAPLLAVTSSFCAVYTPLIKALDVDIIFPSPGDLASVSRLVTRLSRLTAIMSSLTALVVVKVSLSWVPREVDTASWESVKDGLNEFGKTLVHLRSGSVVSMRLDLVDGDNVSHETADVSCLRAVLGSHIIDVWSLSSNMYSTC